jgi:hypothetical protein
MFFLNSFLTNLLHRALQFILSQAQHHARVCHALRRKGKDKNAGKEGWNGRKVKE